MGCEADLTWTHVGLWVGLTALVIALSGGCTTLSHEPRCTCDCKKLSAHFECGGKSEYKDIKGAR